MPYSQGAWRASVTNGRIPRHMLAVIEPEDYDADLRGPAMMHPEAAWNYQRMRKAAREDGVTLAISYSYRTYDKQVEKYADYQAGGNLAAKPGTSNHGWATALDLNIPHYPAANTNPAFKWLKENARRFGFHNNDAPSEPWHWDYEGGHPIEEDQLTDAEKRKLDEAHDKAVAMARAVDDFLAGKQPDDIADTGLRRKTLRALCAKADSNVGPAGPAGPAGPEGPQGPKGDKGDSAVLAPGVKLTVTE